MSWRTQRVQERLAQYKARGGSWRQAIKDQCAASIRNARERQLAARRGSSSHDADAPQTDAAMDAAPAFGGAAGAASAAAAAAAAAPYAAFPDSDGSGSMVPAILASVWRSLQGDGGGGDGSDFSTNVSVSPMLPFESSSATGAADLADAETALTPEEEQQFLLAIYEDLDAELREQERAIMEELLERERDEEAAALDQAVSEYQASTESWGHDAGSPVCCPVCKAHNLSLNCGVLFCPCGLRLHVHNEALTLDSFRLLLQRAFQEHAHTGCLSQPQFGVDSVGSFGPPSLLMICDSCECFEIVA